MKKFKFGVVVGRFQSPILTSAHIALIERAISESEQLVVLVGVHKTQPTARNPMDFTTRSYMIAEAYPQAVVLPIVDQHDDEAWVKSIDSLVSNTFSASNDEIMFYGGRDSFIECYNNSGGRFQRTLIESHLLVNATSIREEVKKAIMSSEEFRRGIVYAITNRFPSPYLTVDAAILNERDKTVLVAKKSDNPKLRFVGGFVDSSDESSEQAAKREVAEETGRIETSNYKLLGNYRIDDKRYSNDKESIMTNFYACDYIFGVPIASDDISELHWVRYSDLNEKHFVDEHAVLVRRLKLHLNISDAP